MPRLARVVVPGVPHHVTERGNRRQPTFFCDDDYEAYLDPMAAIRAWHRIPFPRTRRVRNVLHER